MQILKSSIPNASKPGMHVWLRSTDKIRIKVNGVARTVPPNVELSVKFLPSGKWDVFFKKAGVHVTLDTPAVNKLVQYSDELQPNKITATNPVPPITKLKVFYEALSNWLWNIPSTKDKLIIHEFVKNLNVKYPTTVQLYRGAAVKIDSVDGVKAHIKSDSKSKSWSGSFYTAFLFATEDYRDEHGRGLFSYEAKASEILWSVDGIKICVKEWQTQNNNVPMTELLDLFIKLLDYFPENEYVLTKDVEGTLHFVNMDTLSDLFHVKTGVYSKVRGHLVKHASLPKFTGNEKFVADFLLRLATLSSASDTKNMDKEFLALLPQFKKLLSLAGIDLSHDLGTSPIRVMSRIGYEVSN